MRSKQKREDAAEAGLASNSRPEAATEAGTDDQLASEDQASDSATDGQADRLVSPLPSVTTDDEPVVDLKSRTAEELDSGAPSDTANYVDDDEDVNDKEAKGLGDHGERDHPADSCEVGDASVQERDDSSRCQSVAQRLSPETTSFQTPLASTSATRRGRRGIRQPALIVVRHTSHGIL
jgi:hypothetical protein